MSKVFMYQELNSGMYLDVFPLDDLDITEGQQIYDRVKQLAMQCGKFMKSSNPEYSAEEQAEFQKYKDLDAKKVFNEIHGLARSCKDKSTRYCACMVETIFSYDRKIWHKEDFENTVEVDFEGYKFPAPAGYDRILKSTYGNYMEFPPVEARGAWHDNVVFDADKPYTYYAK